MTSARNHWNFLIEEQIANFRTSAIGAFADRAPWELTNSSVEIVQQLVDSLRDEYVFAENIAIHRQAVIENGCTIKGPAIIGPKCFIAMGAYIRGGCWLEGDCTLGPGSELKSSFVFANSKLAHFNFVGDSIIGTDVNLEAGSIIANYRNEESGSSIALRYGNKTIDTGMTKFGAVVGDRTKIGANAVIAPGAVLPSDTVVSRLSLIDQGK